MQEPLGTPPTVVFDLDGTLADSLRDLVPAINRTLLPHDISPVTALEIGHLTARGGLKAMIEFAFVRDQQTLSQARLEDVFEACVQDYHLNIAVNTDLYPGVRACLKKFKEEGWLLGVCTNKPVTLANELLRALTIDQFFNVVTGGDSFSFKKPDPLHLLKTIELAEGASNKAIMVGDTETDILTARRAGVPSIGVSFGYSDQPLDVFCPDLVTSHFDCLFDVASKICRTLPLTE